MTMPYERTRELVNVVVGIDPVIKVESKLPTTNQRKTLMIRTSAALETLCRHPTSRLSNNLGHLHGKLDWYPVVKYESLEIQLVGARLELRRRYREIQSERC